MSARLNIVPFVADELDHRNKHSAALKRALTQLPAPLPLTDSPELVPQVMTVPHFTMPGQRVMVPRPAGLDTGAASTANIPILSLRLKDLAINDDWYLWVEDFWLASTAGTAVDARVGLYIDPTIGGTDAVSYADVAGSHGHSGSTVRLERDITRDITNVVSAGTRIWEGVSPLALLSVEQEQHFPRTPILAGRNEELVFAAQNLVSGQQTFLVHANVRLLYLPGLPAS